MYKRAIIIILFFSLSLKIYGDSIVLQNYIQQFSEGDNFTKIDVLKNAGSDCMLNESAGYLYDIALLYVLENFTYTENHSDMKQIISISLNGLVNINHTNNAEALWTLFMKYPDPETRTEILIALGFLGKGNQNIIYSINGFLEEMNSLFSSGAKTDYSLVSACIITIMKLGDSSSYKVLFDVMRGGYPEVIVLEAFGALDLVPGNLFGFLYNIIAGNPPNEKLIALRAVSSSERLSISERGQLAELALELAIFAGDEDPAISAMRFLTVSVLTPLRWTRANTLAIRHYHLVYEDFLANAVLKSRFIEAIAFLGTAGNSEAALLLGLQLGLINAGTRSASLFDSDITLAIIRALGNIGDNAVFNQLLHARNLTYNQNIRTAAGEAIERLRW